MLLKVSRLSIQLGVLTLYYINSNIPLELIARNVSWNVKTEYYNKDLFNM